MVRNQFSTRSTARPNEPRVTVEIAGGLGNQFFEYATARRLTIRTGVPLYLDNVSGFARDPYGRTFLLGEFNIHAQLMDPRQSYATPTGRIRRRVHRFLSARRPFERRTYIQERRQTFESQLLSLEPTSPIYLEGMWQHEQYFRDIRDQLLIDFTIKSPHEPVNLDLAALIKSVDAICVHVRRLQTDPAHHLPKSYYERAVELIAPKLRQPHLFIFSDTPDWARDNMRFPFPMRFVTHNFPGKDLEDFWLMSLCRYFVIANSSFSWWAAWLSSREGKIVIAPQSAIGHALTDVPQEWILL